jgi:hypothetical protein
LSTVKRQHNLEFGGTSHVHYERIDNLTGNVSRTFFKRKEKHASPYRLKPVVPAC